MRSPSGPFVAALLVFVATQIAVVADPLPVAAADIASVDCSVPEASSEQAGPGLSESFEPQVPVRVVDTRKATGGVDGALDAGCTLAFDTSGLVPGDATAIAMSLTVISPDVGFFTAFPCGAGLPETSNVNARRTTATANLVIVEPDDDARVCVYSSAGGQVIVDVAGWFAPGPNRFAPIDPTRVADTRRETPAAKLPAGTVREVQVTDGAVPDDAVAVAVNVAAVQADEKGFMVAYPCGGDVPLASNLNFVAGENRASSAIVAIGTGGRICISSNVTTHFIADVTGHYAPAESLLSFAEFGPTVGLRPVVDTRVVDTRTTSLPGDRFGAGSTQRFALRPFLDSPDATVAVALNVVATRADSPGFVTVYPCTGQRPTTSSLNYDLGQTANLVVTKVSAATEVCVYTSTAVDMAIDLFGAFSEVADAPTNSIVFEREVGRKDPAVFETVGPDRAFDDGLEYTLPCGLGGENLQVVLDLAPQVSATVNGSTIASSGVLPVAIPSDGLVKATLASGETTRTYSFRCSPSEFPEFAIGFEREVGPGFEPLEPDQEFDGGSDYTLRCEASGETLRVGVATTPDVSVEVNGAAADGGPAVVSVAKDGLVTVTLSFEAASRDYHYRCLPPDFPRFTVDTLQEPEAGWYTYGSSITAGRPVYGSYLIVLDERFVPVWFKSTGDDQFLDFRGLSDGSIVAAQGGDGGFGIRNDQGHDVWNLDGSLIEVRKTVTPPVVPPDYTGAYPTDFHEYEEIEYPGGDRGRAVISYPPIADQDLTGATPTGGPPFTASEDIVGNVVQEFDGAGALTWNWDIVDHFGYDEVQFGARTTNGVDPFHINSVDRVNDTGCEPTCDYVVSARHLDAVFRIDRKTDEVKWILRPFDIATPNTDGVEPLTIVGDIYGGPKRQHDARMVGDRLTLFDNRTATGQPSRFVEYRIDEAAGTATLVKQIINPGLKNSTFAGSGSYTPDGSILMAWSVTEPLFVEYDADGNELQRLTNDPTDGSYRIHKFAPGQFDADELRATSGGTIAS